MQVSKWGNSLAIRLPAAVVEGPRGCQEGDEIEVHVVGERAFDIDRDRKPPERALGADPRLPQGSPPPRLGSSIVTASETLHEIEPHTRIPTPTS